MDKAQARILSLVLIAVLFIGQAIYNYIKKMSTARPSAHQRPSNPRRSTAPKEKLHSFFQITSNNQQLKQTKPINKSPFLDAEMNAAPETSTQLSESATAVNETAFETTDQTCRPSHDELRKMVVWNEILKRKF